MQISHATRAAPGRAVNEDCVVTGPDFAVVLDGATPSPGVDTGCVHDVAWLVRALGSELARLLLTERRSLTDILAAAIAAVMRRHEHTCDLANPDSPSSTVAMVRARADEVDYLVLSDSPVVLRDKAGAVEVVHDDRLERLPAHTVEIISAKRNAPGGFWVASTTPEAADQARTGSVPRERLDCAGLFTDGAARLAERHGLSWTQLLRLLEQNGPAAVIERVRHEDERAAGRYRGKTHDDATAVLCRF